MAKTLGLIFILTIGFALFASLGIVQPANAQEQVEVGKVKWMRSLDQAKALSSRSGKPLFEQFQEVPG